MGRRVVAVLMALVFAMWSAPLGAQEATPAPDENITGPGSLCTPVLTGILVGGVVTTDLVVLNNPSVSPVAVSATWGAADGTTNVSNFTMPPRSQRITSPADVGFTANGVYFVIVRGGGGLFIAAAKERLQNGQITSEGTCYFLN